jgi:hypothetical protein
MGEQKTMSREYYSPAEYAQRLARLYPHVTPYRFAYRGDLNSRQRFHGIKIWFLLYDEAVGYTVCNLNFWHASFPKTPRQWGEWVKNNGAGKIANWWLPSHNAHYETDRELRKILMFHRQDKDRGSRYS